MVLLVISYFNNVFPLALFIIILGTVISLTSIIMVWKGTSLETVCLTLIYEGILASVFILISTNVFPFIFIFCISEAPLVSPKLIRLCFG